ncbi:MFS transporter [Streptomyces sp. NPDC054844]
MLERSCDSDARSRHRLIPEEELPAANALGSTVMQTGQVVGPLLAGALIPVVGLPELYLIDALALCVTVWAVYRLRDRRDARAHAGRLHRRRGGRPVPGRRPARRRGLRPSAHGRRWPEAGCSSSW